jgi:hypothetical protein
MAPRPRAVRVAGTLDTISSSKPDFVLTLVDGTTVAARFHTGDIEQLKTLFGKRVVIDGVAQFSSAGALVNIDVEHLGPAHDGDELFERVPDAGAKPVAATLSQGATTGVSAFFGTWPGDETDEELLEALKAIR